MKSFSWKVIAPLALVITLGLAASTVLAAHHEGDGFVPIFDGETLDGWHAIPKDSAGDWSVIDGTIVGQGSVDQLAYLVFNDEDLTDFELKLSYRFPSDGNSGVEIHAVPDKTGGRPFLGYHADIGHVGIGPGVLGAWDFHFAGREEYACFRGTSLIIDEDGKTTSSEISGALETEDINENGWNEMHIIAKGNHYSFSINGKVASEFTDNAKEGQLKKGIIGLQIHDAGMRVDFKDVKLKRTDGKSTK
jgi:hypothetical protein